MLENDALTYEQQISALREARQGTAEPIPLSFGDVCNRVCDRAESLKQTIRDKNEQIRELQMKLADQDQQLRKVLGVVEAPVQELNKPMGIPAVFDR